MPKRNDKRDTAKAEYVKRRRSGEKINLKEFAATLGVTYGTVRNWKKIDRWEDAIERKRGGQPGNKNSRGKKNAKGNTGGGAPDGNTNAEKDGAYSTIHLDRLTEEERAWLDAIPTGASANNAYELKLLRIQQRHIMEKIAVREVQPGRTVYGHHHRYAQTRPGCRGQDGGQCRAEDGDGQQR